MPPLTITGYTAARMKTIEDTAIVSGAIVGGHLILHQHNGVTIDSGSVIGPMGPTGLTGATSIVPCTSATRPTTGLFNGLAIYETNTKLLYIWDGTAWNYRGGAIICTSASHPAFPILGLEIYETDTRRKLIWNGVRFDPPWAEAWGAVALPINISTDSGNFTSLADISGTTIPWMAVANRRHRVTVSAQVTNTAAFGITIVIADSAQVPKRQFSYHPQAGGVNDNVTFIGEIISIPAGATSLHLRASTVSGTGTLKGSVAETFFCVEDAGPIGVPV